MFKKLWSDLAAPRGVQRSILSFRPLLTAALTLGLALSPVLAATSGPTTLGGTYQSTIVDWPKGKIGTIQMGTLSWGVIDANGHFSLTLPTPDQIASSLFPVSGLLAEKSNQETCKGQGTATPTTAHWTEAGLQASIDGGNSIFLKLKSDTHLPYPLGQGYSNLTYFDVPTTMNGTVSCNGYTETFKGMFPAGWSLPSGTVTAISADGVYSDLLTANALPKNVTWHLYDLVTGVGIGLAPVLVGPPGVNITRVTPGAPAEGAGVRLNDLLVEVNGKSVAELSVDEVSALIRGDAGTVVTLGVMRGSETAIRRIPVTRALIQVP